MEAAVCRLPPLKSGGHTHLRAKHFKQWLREACPGENSKTPPWTEHCMCLVDTTQHMWRMGYIPQELGWTALVLIHKGTTYTRGTGLLETLWKVVEALIDTRLRASLQFHDILHRFWARRGTGTAIMELKLAQELVSIYQEPLFLLLLHLRKAYDIVDRERLIQTLEVYGTGPRLCGLFETLWSHQKVVPR